VPNTSKQNLERLAAALRELNARQRVGSMCDEEARPLPMVVDAATLESFGSSTWMTGAGPLDLLVELRDRDGGRHSYRGLARRAVRYEVGGVTVSLVSLDDIDSKEFAGREKDREGLPELHGLRCGLRDPE
jgi:hypothetical protein